VDRPTALVTGAAGFIGSHLCDRLLAEGWSVTGIDSFEPFYARELKEANLTSAGENPDFRLVEGKIQDLGRGGPGASQLSELIEDAEVVFHLAAQAGVRGSWGPQFASYLDENALATQIVLEHAKAGELRKFVYASSSSVYGDTNVLPMREDAQCRPYSPYGVTKLAGESLAYLYARNFGVPAVAVRFFTVYGPRQRPDMAFNRFMRCVMEGRPIEIYGDGEQTRDFTFVSDIVDGVLAALEAPAGEVYNLGGGSRVRLADAVATLLEAAGAPDHEVIAASVQAGDVRDTSADLTKAAGIGYAPKVDLATGLAREWGWLRGSVSAG
jgi:nucleoside-diphosphate-sugar epimerase